MQVENALADEQARLQFQLIEGLDQKVVRPGLHGLEHVLATVFAGQQNHVDVRAGQSGFPDAPAKLNAFQIRQHPIEQHELGSILLPQDLPSCGARLRQGDAEIPASQMIADQFAIDG